MTQNATDRTPSRSLFAVTELTVLAPLKRGPIAAMDTRSHETRVVAVMRTLDAFRVSSVESQPTPLLQDVIDHIRGIHSFRLAVVGEPLRRQLLLSVSFDGGWEPYLRRIWRDLGPFLDLLFCNCEGYPLSRNSGFDDYARWVRGAQVTSEFFFHWGPATVNDLVTEFARPPGGPTRDADAPMGERLRQSLQALKALYRLSDLHPPGALNRQPGLRALAVDDGHTLLHAAQHLLPLLKGLDDSHLHVVLGRAPTPVESAALLWLQADVPQTRPTWPAVPWSLQQVQGGIVHRFEGVRDAALLLLSLDTPRAAAGLLKWLLDDEARRLARGDDSAPPGAAGDVFWTVAFTATGLEHLGLDEGHHAQLPAEFLQGMAARASVLGDVLHNHPANWKPPLACQPDGSAAPTDSRVDLAGVHVLLQLAKRGGGSTRWREAPDPAHPLHAAIGQLLNAQVSNSSPETLAQRGLRLLSVQTLSRAAPPVAGGVARGHFGFVDGLSQPVIRPAGPTPAPPGKTTDELPTGDLLLGHPNSLGDEPLRGRLWDNGSFLVVRRLRQDVQAWEAAVQAATAALRPSLNLTPDQLAGLLMGRARDGRNLIDGTTGNTFDYGSDPAGVKCPWQSHVRRANPRTLAATAPAKPLASDQHGPPAPPSPPPPAPPTPRLLRRGMSFGPTSTYEGPADAERGLMFMAYNASIAEQFERIQGWLAGGNSSQAQFPSKFADPFLGVRHPGDEAQFRFRWPVAPPPADQFTEHEVSLGTKPFTVLEWGLYLFVPSVAALGELQRIADEAHLSRQPTALPAIGTAAPTVHPQRRRALDVEAQRLAAGGSALVAQLFKAEQVLGLDHHSAAREWKLLLEDPAARRQKLPQMLWAAVRAAPGGVMRTPYGVLVGSAERVAEVFEDRQRRYTVAGYQARMERSFGPIYLGMDAGADYEREARDVNAALMAVKASQAFEAARQAMTQVLLGLQPPANAASAASAAASPETAVDVRDLVDGLLVTLSKQWFGLPDATGTHVQAGGWHWRAAPPSCPGHFHTPSRYLFQPHPGAEAAAVGEAHGQLLRDSVRDMVRLNWQQPAALGTLGQSIHRALGRLEPSPFAAQDLVARTLIGVMMGFLPTVDGNLRGLLFDWLDNGSFWDLRRRLAAALAAPDPLPASEWALTYAVLRQPLARALQSRPVPDTVWRTVVQAHTIGEVHLQPGEVVVVGIGSALHQRQLDDDASLSALFGGDRRDPGQNSAPLHACPGQAMAMGVLTGALAALMAAPTLSAGPTPAVLTLGR